MRLIDADNVKEKKVYSHERHEKVVPVAEIDWMPTIDAIPFAWLKIQINEALDDNETELASDIDWLIRKYKNEQEEHGI